MPNDDLLEELHRTRAMLLAEAGGTIDGLVAKLKELEAQEQRRIVKLPPKRVEVSQGEVA